MVKFRVSLWATSYSIARHTVVMSVTGQGQKTMALVATDSPKVAHLKEVLSWPELIDVAIDKSRREFELHGEPAQPGRPQQGRSSERLTLDCELDYSDLKQLFDVVGGFGFFSAVESGKRLHP